MSRIVERLDRIYAIAQHRAGYSAEEDAAHELAATWMVEAGLEVSRDPVGNLLGSRGQAEVWCGSHLDSVPTAGRFDGALGVVAALEAAERLPDAPLTVVAFRSEESGPAGSRRLASFPKAYLELHIEQGPVLADLGDLDVEAARLGLLLQQALLLHHGQGQVGDSELLREPHGRNLGARRTERPR